MRSSKLALLAGLATLPLMSYAQTGKAVEVIEQTVKVATEKGGEAVQYTLPVRSLIEGCGSFVAPATNPVVTYKSPISLSPSLADVPSYNLTTSGEVSSALVSPMGTTVRHSAHVITSPLADNSLKRNVAAKAQSTLNVPYTARHYKMLSGEVISYPELYQWITHSPMLATARPISSIKRETLPTEHPIWKLESENVLKLYISPDVDDLYDALLEYAAMMKHLRTYMEGKWESLIEVQGRYVNKTDFDVFDPSQLNMFLDDTRKMAKEIYEYIDKYLKDPKNPNPQIVIALDSLQTIEMYFCQILGIPLAEGITINLPHLPLTEELILNMRE